MRFFGFLVPVLIVWIGAWRVTCRHHRHTVDRKKAELVEQARGYAAIREDEKNLVSSGREKKETAKGGIPFSERRLEKMLEKAILKIITGDLSTGDMLLLKSLNYSLEEVLAIRERELGKKRDEDLWRRESVKPWAKSLYAETEKETDRFWEKNGMDRSSPKKLGAGREERKRDGPASNAYKDFDFEAYNRQAILDYENLPSNAEFQSSWPEATALDYEETTRAPVPDQRPGNDLRRDFDRAMEPHVVFKIRYDDSEFDSSSGSDERNRQRASRHRVTSAVRHSSSRSDSFHASTPPAFSSTTAAAVPLVYQLSSSRIGDKYFGNAATVTATATENASLEDASRVEKTTNSSDEIFATPSNEGRSSESKRISEYEGLEWVEDDVYRVIPEFVDSLAFENTEDNETSDYEDTGSQDSRANWRTDGYGNDTLEYQNDETDSVKFHAANGNATANNLPLANLSTYLQAAIAHRRGGNVTSSSFDSQGEKAIEDIKSRVLALTGRFNLSTSSNQVQRERLTMFSPTCQIPRNTDQDAWTDPFSMNMHFQLNLTSGDHVVAAKLRIFKLPQENVTSSLEGGFDEDEEDEKKIRISVYYYTKSLKRHRSKKRLMDSVVTPLTSRGNHLALDVRQGLRYWRLNPRNSHSGSGNHGLLVQVEDQEGKPLKPAQYIQQPSCADQDSEQKPSDYLHSSYEPVLVTFAS